MSATLKLLDAQLCAVKEACWRLVVKHCGCLTGLWAFCAWLGAGHRNLSLAASKASIAARQWKAIMPLQLEGPDHKLLRATERLVSPEGFARPLPSIIGTLRITHRGGTLEAAECCPINMSARDEDEKHVKMQAFLSERQGTEAPFRNSASIQMAADLDGFQLHASVLAVYCTIMSVCRYHISHVAHRFRLVQQQQAMHAHSTTNLMQQPFSLCGSLPPPTFNPPQAGVLNQHS